MAPAVDQRSVMFKLGKYGLEPMLREISMALAADNLGVFKDVRLVGLSVVGTLIGRMPEEDFNFVCDKMLFMVSQGGKNVTIDDFRGDMQTYTQLLIAALGLNFRDFSSFLSQMMKSTATGADQEAKDQQTPQSTGSSGAPASE